MRRELSIQEVDNFLNSFALGQAALEVKRSLRAVVIRDLNTYLHLHIATCECIDENKIPLIFKCFTPNANTKEYFMWNYVVKL